jgi:hypothetical protein
LNQIFESRRITSLSLSSGEKSEGERQTCIKQGSYA